MPEQGCGIFKRRLSCRTAREPASAGFFVRASNADGSQLGLKEFLVAVGKWRKSLILDVTLCDQKSRSKSDLFDLYLLDFIGVAGEGFEPPTLGL